VTEQVIRTTATTNPSAREVGSGGQPGAAYRSSPVLATKLHPPTSRPGSVVRRLLLDRLAEERWVKVVLVVAPAGWGKTTLVGDWFRTVRESPGAWLSLDCDDNDPMRFWTDVIACLQEVSPGFGTGLSPLLVAPGISLPDDFVPRLLNELAELPAPVELVIDDYHLISSDEVERSMTALVEHLPMKVRLVLVTRADPALPLARLRVRGALVELRADDLAFTQAETKALLNEGLDLDLAPEDIVRLHRRTEGWAAGLYLAGLSLRSRHDRSRFVDDFAGDDRHVVDYLVSEVLDDLPVETRTFLLRTSILGRLCGSLCDAVLEQRGSDRTLEELERSNRFLIPLDNRRRWYRYHHLFAELLQYELHTFEPTIVPALHRRAASWLQREGDVSQAISHLITAGDMTEARELIATEWNRSFNEGLSATVESWLDSLPSEVVRGDARMCLIRAWLARHLGKLDEVEPWLESSERATPKGPLRDEVSSVESATCLIRAGYRHMVGDLAGATSSARRAAELECNGTPRWRAVSMATLGANLCWRGQDAESVALLEELVSPTRPPANNLAALWALGCLAAMHARVGDLDAAERLVEQATELAVAHGLAEYWVGTTAWLASAQIFEGRGQLCEAEAAALRGLELAKRGRARLEIADALLGVARIRAGRGDASSARDLLVRASETIAACPDPGIVAEVFVSTERCVSASRGERPAAVDGPGELSPKERSVLRLLASDLSLHEIARELFVSHNTIKTQTQSIYRKLAVSNRAEAVARSRDDGIN
jgi:LuxR family maltose regulon positive regulatory protein